MEPEQLRRGKAFHRLVQSDYIENTKGGGMFGEKVLSFSGLKNVKQKSGRMDLFLDQTDEDNSVTIIEIKATDWDKIKPANVRRNLYRHGRQLHQYIDKFMEVDKLGQVGLAMIYPSPPKKPGLREEIEEVAMEKYAFPVYWYNELKD